MGDTENILQAIKTTVQDLVAPDVRELKVRMSSLENHLEAMKDQNKVHYDVLRSQADAQFKTLIAAISQSKAETELSVFKQIAALTERVAALEAHRQ